jgi:hypothetical protein
MIHAADERLLPPPLKPGHRAQFSMSRGDLRLVLMPRPIRHGRPPLVPRSKMETTIEDGATLPSLKGFSLRPIRPGTMRMRARHTQARMRIYACV